MTDSADNAPPPEPLILEQKAAEALKFYTENYETLFFEGLGTGHPKIVLGSKPQKCRFCAREKPEVSLKNEAHAVPELVGNKRLFALYECNDCNDRFSSFEDDLAKLTLGDRSLAQIRGKKGIPTLTEAGQKSRIEHNSGQMHIRQILGEKFVAIDEEGHTVDVTYKTQPYRPLGVYKALAKVAYTLLPNDELPHFPELKAWLKEKDVGTKKVYAAGNHILSSSFVPGPMPFPQPIVGLFRRKQDVIAPYCVLLLVYGNYSMQIFVPCPLKDAHLKDKTISVYTYPHIYQLQPWLALGAVQVKHEDISSSLKQSFPKKMSLHFDSKISNNRTKKPNP